MSNCKNLHHYGLGVKIMSEFQPRWYQEAIIYELHIRAFFDSNNDGNGDFRGLVEKLDYLQDLGVTAIWLLPFYPSPLKDDGYDIADYTSVNPTYGNLNDFKLLLREAHRRDIRVITELVMNHTSDQHPWFQRARQAKAGSKWRDFYVWSDTAEEYRDARIIFKDFETSNWTWDPVANAYFWHRFYSHQPDLNFKSPDVQKAVLGWIDFWLAMGVDGLRLDAVPYLYERDGTNCENLPETHQFLKKIRKYIDDHYKDRMLLAEANQWPEDAIAYFGEGDECNMAFHFPLMPRMFMSLRMEDRFPLIDIMQQTPSIPSMCQWSIFLRNHDELTLEMVTDEERDYMYRVYAEDPQARINLGIRRRLAPLLSNNRKKIELMNGLLFSLPGTPVIYYGDEIGMGDNFYLGDRNGVRTPMQWSPDRNAGFSQSHPQRLFLPVIIDPEYHYESINVSTQQNNPESLLWWMKHLLALRKKYHALALGTLRFLFPENPKVLAFITEYQEQRILVIANLSRFSEYIELDLTEWKGMRLLELFGQTPFPEITIAPYFITLNAHSFYWFLVEKLPLGNTGLDSSQIESPSLNVANWEILLKKDNYSKLESILPNFLIQQRWFGAKTQVIKSIKIIEVIQFSLEQKKAYLILVQISHLKEEEEIYCLPITFATEEESTILKVQFPKSLIAHLPKQNGYLIDAYYDREFTQLLLENISENTKNKGLNGVLVTQRSGKFRDVFKDEEIKDSQPIKAEQSNTSIAFDKKLIVKFYRRCSFGINPDIEIGRFLSEKSEFLNTPGFVGSLEYRLKNGNLISIGTLQQYISHENDGWQYTIDNINRFFEGILTSEKLHAEQIPPPSLLKYFENSTNIPEEIQAMMGDYGFSASLLGKRTAEMHIALASDSEDEDFVPEPFSTLYQRTIYQSIRGLFGRTLTKIRKNMPNFSEPIQEICDSILQADKFLEIFLRKIIDRKISGMRIRCHGDFHLGQVLFTGKDFIIVDFEGEPARPLSERRIKRSPLRDVAGMMRSFHYATQTALYGKTSIFRKEDIKALETWANFWYQWSCAYFLQGYLENARDCNFLSKNPEDNAIILQAFLLEKAIYEIGYELNNRPDWVHIPCRGLLELLK